MKINRCVVIGLWAIAYASNTLCLIVEGPFEYNFELQEYTERKLSDYNSIICQSTELLYLYKYVDRQNYGIGSYLSARDNLVHERRSLAANDIGYHVMHSNLIQIPLHKYDLLLEIKFNEIRDAQTFYALSANYENRESIGPFTLKLSSLGKKLVRLTLYTFDFGKLCEFKSQNDETSENWVPQLIMPTSSFYFTQIYHQKMIALVENLTTYVLKFNLSADAAAFKTQINGVSSYIPASEHLESLIKYYYENL